MPGPVLRALTDALHSEPTERHGLRTPSHARPNPGVSCRWNSAGPLTRLFFPTDPRSSKPCCSRVNPGTGICGCRGPGARTHAFSTVWATGAPKPCHDQGSTVLHLSECSGQHVTFKARSATEAALALALVVRALARSLGNLRLPVGI